MGDLNLQSRISPIENYGHYCSQPVKCSLIIISKSKRQDLCGCFWHYDNFSLPYNVIFLFGNKYSTSRALYIHSNLAIPPSLGPGQSWRYIEKVLCVFVYVFSFFLLLLLLFSFMLLNLVNEQELFRPVLAVG